MLIVVEVVVVEEAVVAAVVAVADVETVQARTGSAFVVVVWPSEIGTEVEIRLAVPYSYY